MFETLGGYVQTDYWLSKFLIQRSIGLIYLIAFVNALHQFIPLLGENGLLPASRLTQKSGIRSKPSLFHWYYSDQFFRGVCWAGIVLSVAALSGLADSGPFWLSIIVWSLLWFVYLSIVNIGYIFYGFGWESMLLEIGFYVIFLGPLQWASPVLVIWIIRWMLFRVEFGAGLIKMRGDRCWRELTCMNYHHETQPLPNPLSWYFHRLPEFAHKTETFFNHLVQLVIVWGLFFPQPVAAIAAVLIILSQGYLIVSGNYSWLNWLTIILAFSGFSDPVAAGLTGISLPETSPLPYWFEIVVIILTLVVAYLSIRPVGNMLSNRQKMNFSFNPLHLVNTYGAFGRVTKKRYEIIIEGTDDPVPAEESDWKEYEFKGKPGDPARRPPLVSPYHLRLDWQIWFAAMSPSPARHPWFEPLIAKLLTNDRELLKLFKKNPLPDQPPTFIRARRFIYRYTTLKEKKETENWWEREYVHDYLSPRGLNPDSSQTSIP